MGKTRFYSELFRREIHNSEPEYKQKAIAEALYRIYILEKENCSCMKCRQNLKEFKAFLENQLK